MKIFYFRTFYIALFLTISHNSMQVHATIKFPIYVSKVIALYLLKKKDAMPLFQLVQKNRNYLRQWLPWVDAVKKPLDQEVFIRTENQRWKESKGLTLGIWYDKKLVGIVCFHAFDWKQRSAPMGYWIDEGHQGKGIVTQSCQALIAVGFQQLNLQDVTISCATENYKSWAIPLKLGFVWQKTILNAEWLYDHYVDHHVYVLKRS
ncbi:MAG: GNAT family protein [Bacteroidota bacterium]